MASNSKAMQKLAKKRRKIQKKGRVISTRSDPGIYTVEVYWETSCDGKTQIGEWVDRLQDSGGHSLEFCKGYCQVWKEMEPCPPIRISRVIGSEFDLEYQLEPVLEYPGHAEKHNDLF